ncbi:cerebellin-1-like [Polymixia lowei]
MSSSIVPLVLLLCMFGAGAQGDEQVETSDIWTEIKGLRDKMHHLGTVVVEQREKLKVTLNHLDFYKNQSEELKKLNADQAAALSLLETRTTGYESELEKLKKQTADRPKVAFSAVLRGNTDFGPFGNDTTLAYAKVFTNIGEAYDSVKGIFTAPVRGSYYFRFTACGKMSSSKMGKALYKNDERIMNLFDYDTDDWYEYASNGAVLELEEGDMVYLVLPKGRKLISSADNDNSFSGFLLFTK